MKKIINTIFCISMENLQYEKKKIHLYRNYMRIYN